MNERPREIRGVMVPVAGSRVLLPNANIAEVITYSPPEAVPGAPAWLLGRVPWRGWRLPLISLPMLAGRSDDEERTSARVAVLKALGGRPGMPFLAMLAQGFPRLTTITPDLLVETADERPGVPGIAAEVQVRDEHALIPDLEAIEALVADALG